MICPMRVGSGQYRRDLGYRVPSARARARVRTLRARGFTFRQIADAAGLSVATIHDVTTSEKCSVVTERALLKLR
jgi:hypothetical protein